MRTTIYLFLSLIFSSCADTKSPESATKTVLPNIVIIFTDDQGYQDLGCFGSPDIQTPNIDQMAREGARLTNFYVSQPVCSASRASLLTGCYANRLGIHGAFMPYVKKGLLMLSTCMKQLAATSSLHGPIISNS